jgi:ribosomal protein L20A (L18A)
MFSFFLMGIMIFFVCVLLKSVEIQLGIALGLFAIFAILRFRSQNLSLRQMTYFFTVIGVAVINAMAGFYHPVRGPILVNSVIILSVFLLEMFLNERAPNKKKIKNKDKKDKNLRKTILVYNRLELLNQENTGDLLSDISSRTKMKIEKVEIKKIDLIKGNAELEIFFRDKTQEHE